MLKKIEEASLAKWKAVEWALCKNKVEQLNKVNSVKLGEALGDTTPGQMLEGVNKLMKVITVSPSIAVGHLQCRRSCSYVYHRRSCTLVVERHLLSRSSMITSLDGAAVSSS